MFFSLFRSFLPFFFFFFQEKPQTILPMLSETVQMYNDDRCCKQKDVNTQRINEKAYSTTCNINVKGEQKWKRSLLACNTHFNVAVTCRRAKKKNEYEKNPYRVSSAQWRNNGKVIQQNQIRIKYEKCYLFDFVWRGFSLFHLGSECSRLRQFLFPVASNWKVARRK